MADKLMVDKLTDLQKQVYLASGGDKCPFCGSKDITGGHLEVDGTGAWQNVDCETCEESWVDVYTLTDVESIG